MIRRWHRWKHYRDHSRCIHCGVQKKIEKNGDGVATVVWRDKDGQEIATLHGDRRWLTSVVPCVDKERSPGSKKAKLPKNTIRSLRNVQRLCAALEQQLSNVLSSLEGR